MLAHKACHDDIGMLGHQACVMCCLKPQVQPACCCLHATHTDILTPSTHPVLSAFLLCCVLCCAVKEMLLSSSLNFLMLCVPLGIAAQYCNWGATAVFILNFLALIPLALLLGDVTEDLAVRFGDTVGGLLNATFGNVVEMILSIAALQQGLYTVVAASLLGSILSNLLLVLGGCRRCGQQCCECRISCQA